MELVLFNRSDDIFRGVMNLANKKINTLRGVVIMSPEEKKEIISYSKKVYQRVYSKTKTEFTGHIRLDLVPGIRNFEKTSRGYKWDLFIRGIYEINSNAPECGAATAALHHGFPELARFQPSPAERIVESLNGQIANKRVGFIIGEGIVKKEWGSLFMKEMEKRGLRVERIEMNQIDNYECVWRFGDIRSGEAYSEFPEWFKKALCEKQRGGSFILNTVAETPEEDIGNKYYLMGKNDRELLDEEDLRWAVEDGRDLVLKPFRGASGKGIVFKKGCRNTEEWKGVLKKRLNRGFGLFEAKWLPRLAVDEVNDGIAIDISPSFLANGSEITYLYSIMRVEKYSEYEKRGTINVAKGAGFVGTVID